MGKVRNIFAIEWDNIQKIPKSRELHFTKAKSIWNEGTQRLLAA